MISLYRSHPTQLWRLRRTFDRRPSHTWTRFTRLVFLQKRKGYPPLSQLLPHRCVLEDCPASSARTRLATRPRRAHQVLTSKTNSKFNRVHALEILLSPELSPATGALHQRVPRQSPQGQLDDRSLQQSEGTTKCHSAWAPPVMYQKQNPERSPHHHRTPVRHYKTQWQPSTIRHFPRAIGQINQSAA